MNQLTRLLHVSIQYTVCVVPTFKWVGLHAVSDLSHFNEFQISKWIPAVKVMWFGNIMLTTNRHHNLLGIIDYNQKKCVSPRIELCTSWSGIIILQFIFKLYWIDGPIKVYFRCGHWLLIQGTAHIYMFVCKLYIAKTSKDCEFNFLFQLLNYFCEWSIETASVIKQKVLKTFNWILFVSPLFFYKNQ